MKIFNFQDYRHYIRSRLETMPESSRGELTALAKAMNIKRPYLSQVLNGSKNLSIEQAFALSKYFELGEYETKYLFELIHLSKANGADFKRAIQSEMKKLRAKSLLKTGEVRDDQPMDERSQAIFYSAWTYSAVHLASGLFGGQTAEQISERLGIHLTSVKTILAFLVDVGLCSTNGVKYFAKEPRTHLPKESALNWRYQTNWRLKALDHIAKTQADDLFFTASVRIDEKTYAEVSILLKEIIQKIKESLTRADDTRLACVNIDLFKF